MANKPEPIDFVVTYVDGTDPAWIQKKNEYKGIKDAGDSRQIRFRSWDNLKYWFRAVEQFAPWVHKVYLVTDGQTPEWINRSCERIVPVNHRDFIPAQYLPVFSSHPIEHNLFRIPGLSEQFVYFNDDVFLLKPVKPTDFFQQGLPCDYAVESPFSVHDRMFSHIVANNVLLLDENYNRKDVIKKQSRKFYSPKDPVGMMQNLAFRSLKRDRFFGFKNAHGPSALLKSSCKAVWEQSYHWLDETCHSRFRSDNDVNQYIYLDYQYVNGLFTPYNWKDRRHLFRCNDENADTIARAIRKQQYTVVCINEADELDFDYAKEVINGAWEDLLPKKSMFEV